MRLLKKWPQLLKPTSKGGVQVWDCEVHVDGDVGVIVTRDGKQGGKMKEHTDRVTVGKNLGRKNETSPIDQAVADAQSKWDTKVTRKGYAEKLEDSKRMEGPMLAQKLVDVADKIDFAAAVMQPKLDGYRCLATRLPDGKIKMVSREHGEFEIPHLQQALACVMRRGEIFDGELYRHGVSLQKIGSWVKKSRPESSQLLMHVYDYPSPKPYLERYAELATRISNVDPLHLVESKICKGHKELVVYRDACIKRGYEGAILRWGLLGYEFGKRSESLVKVKKFIDEEFEVVGYEFGRGGYAKVPRFSCVTAAGKSFMVTAPGSIPEKERFGRTADHYIGCMLTVEFQKWTDDKKPFQPIAKWFREDAALKKAEAAAAKQEGSG